MEGILPMQNSGYITADIFFSLFRNADKQPGLLVHHTLKSGHQGTRISRFRRGREGIKAHFVSPDREWLQELMALAPSQGIKAPLLCQI